MSAMTITASDARMFIVGGIIKVDGKNYRVDKKTCTALAVSRYYWFDALYDKAMEVLYDTVRRVMGAG